MTVDLDKYKVNKKFIQDWFSKGGITLEAAVSTMSIATGVPCIVTSFYIGEILGWNDEVIQKIKRLKEFYGYEEIVNAPKEYWEKVK